MYMYINFSPLRVMIICMSFLYFQRRSSSPVARALPSTWPYPPLIDVTHTPRHTPTHPKTHTHTHTPTHPGTHTHTNTATHTPSDDVFSFVIELAHWFLGSKKYKRSANISSDGFQQFVNCKKGSLSRRSL